MKSPRLLPVVIAATTALLLLKGIGLLTTGGYVLTGTSVALAAGGGHGGSGGGGEAAAGGDPTMALPDEATMTDTAPVLEDSAETMPLTEPAAGGHGGAAEGDAAGDHGAAPEDAAAAEAVPAEGDFVPQDVCPTEEPATDAAASGHGAAPADAAAAPADADAGGHGGAAPSEDAAAAHTEDKTNCIQDPGTNEYGDALPLIKNAEGQIVPLANENPGAEPAVIERLGERRDSLDAREAELAAREDLLKAAERQLDERTAQLKAIEEKVNALVAEKKAAEQEQFVSIVSMYEQMKPKEAATIFNELDTALLIEVASAMNPKKMGPVLAKMDPIKARALTDGMAAQQAQQNGGDLTGADLASLPQIVGQ